MATYLVSYDLRQPGRNYDELYEALKASGSWAKVHESVWAINTSETVVEARDRILATMDKGDGLFVTAVQRASAWEGLSDRVTKWLKDNYAT